MPVHGEQALFERLSLEAFQSGLSWLTILRRREGFRAAFDAFEPERVAAYGPAEVERLMGDERIIRNRRKIEATITNARAVLRLRDTGGVDTLFWSIIPPVRPRPHTTDDVPATTPESVDLARALKAAGFAHLGPTTVYAAMQACGVVDDHLAGCHRSADRGVARETRTS